MLEKGFLLLWNYESETSLWNVRTYILPFCLSVSYTPTQT